jgi:ankyrin repeat protein
MRDINKELCELSRDNLDRTNEISELIKLGANVNIRDENDMPPLLYAILSGNQENSKVIFEYILSSNIDINKEYKNDFILHKAITISLLYEDLVETAKLMIISGIDVNAKDLENKTPLSIAMTTNNNEIAALLIKYGAHDHTARSKTNNIQAHVTYDTANETMDYLFAATKKGKIDVLKDLHAQFHIPLNVKDINGKSLLDHALENKQVKLAEFLLPHYQYKHLDDLARIMNSEDNNNPEIDQQRKSFLDVAKNIISRRENLYLPAKKRAKFSNSELSGFAASYRNNSGTANAQIAVSL